MSDGFNGGLARLLLWYRDPTTGGATGQQSTLAVNTTSGAYVVYGANSAGLKATAGASVQFEGGDKILSVMHFGTPKLDTFEVSIENDDTALQTLVNGGTANNTNTSFEKIPGNSNRQFPMNLGVALQQRRQKDDGAQYFRTLFLPSCDVVLTLGAMGFRGKTPITLSITPQMVTKAHTGQTFGTGATGLSFGIEEAKTDHYIWYSTKPIHVVTYRKNGTATTFNTIYAPLSTVVTLNACPNEKVVNGTPTALVSLTLAGVATVAAGTTGDLAVLTHTTEYVPV